jgi:hypothetical protein
MVEINGGGWLDVVWGLVKGCARLEVIVQALVIDFPLNIDDFIDGIVAGFNAVVWES